MSIQWTLIAGVMYVELAATILLLIPFISPQRWNSIFKSRFLKSLGNMANLYFKIFLGILSLVFLDAIREMTKYGSELADRSKPEMSVHLDAEMQVQMRLFRAQRNFYISGFSLFLWIVLMRLATLITRLAVTMAEKEAAMRQAQSASATASQLLSQDSDEKGRKGEEEQQQATNAANEIKELREENRRIKKERDAALSQGEGVSREYDRLMEEHRKLQEFLKKESTGGECKKDD